jgi:hypothetical protein
MTTLHEIVDPWLLDDDADDLVRLRDQLTWLRRAHFGVYEPDENRGFEDRLVDWLLNVEDDADRRTLFRLLGHLFFVAKPQFRALYRGAFNDAVVRWLIDQEGIPLDAHDMPVRLAAAARETWFCGVTDSMNLNSFLKVNKLQGNELRIDWRSCERIGNADLLREHVTTNGFKRMVLLEDFVGSGGQMRSAVIMARRTLPDMPMMLVPLICCPEGAETGRLIATSFDITFAPTLLLRDDLFLLPAPQPDEPLVFGEARELIERVKDRLGEWEGEPFGHAQTGALLATFANCPDNALPIIHEHSDSWKALFPRIRRE